MTIFADYHWHNGNLLDLLSHETNQPRLNFALLLLSRNHKSLQHLLDLRTNLSLSLDIERSKLAEALLLFQKGNIEESATTLFSIDRQMMIDFDLYTPDNWSSFYHSLYIDLSSVFLETNREWVEGYKLRAVSNLQPIITLGDSHVLSIGWSFGATWYSMPVYLPGIQINQIASTFPNRSKFALVQALASLSREIHIILSLGEIDYRCGPARLLPTKSKTAPYFISNHSELNSILAVELKRVNLAVQFISEQSLPGQYLSILSLPLPSETRLTNSLALSSEVFDLETEFIRKINLQLSKSCEDYSLRYINTEINQTSNCWYDDEVHKTNLFHKSWLDKYVDSISE